jgi:pseudaminic acid cytidylyltransferase
MYWQRMTSKQKAIAVIPARGGSKRIPRKNVKVFSGRPMITYAIAAAQESQLFDHIVVTTDDSEIAEVAQKNGAEVPFMRPVSLSDDFTPTVPVVAHAIEMCEEIDWDFDYVCCIYPCVPFIQVGDLKQAFELLVGSEANFAFPVVEYAPPIQRALKMNDLGEISSFFPDFELSRTQDLERSFHDAGQFYWGSKVSWRKSERVHSGAIGLQVPSWRCVDIDTPEDWINAERVALQTLPLS